MVNTEELKPLVHDLDQALHSLMVMRRQEFSLPGDKNLSKTEKFLIMQLATMNKGKPVMPSEIAEMRGITLAAITHLANALEERGYVTRSSSPDDRRIAYVSLTAKGKSVHEGMKKGYFRKLHGLVEYLGEKDTNALIALIEKIKSYIARTN
jgi:MarR family transcriptional regulator, repressor for mepA